LLAMAAFAPFALLRLVPAFEAGAAAHLEGLGRRPLRALDRLGSDLGLTEAGGVGALAGLGTSLLARGAGNDGGSGGTGGGGSASASSGAARTGSGGAGAGGSDPWAHVNVGPFTAGRQTYGVPEDGAERSPSASDLGGPVASLGAAAAAPEPAGHADKAADNG